MRVNYKIIQNGKNYSETKSNSKQMKKIKEEKQLKQRNKW